MNIKSLLLGSATAFAVVSGAQAADAIVAAAPEPMEYVKVCDAFGTGYFYIPGTETCLKISGLVRWQLNYSSAGGLATATPAVNANAKWSSYPNTMFRLHVEAKNDSEVGTVYSFLRIQGNAKGTYGYGLYAGIDAGATGFEVGSFDTYWTRFFGYGAMTDDGGSYAFVGNSYAAFYGKVGSIAYTAGVDDFTNTAGKTAGLNAAVKGTFDNFGAALGVNYDIAAKSFGMKGYVTAKFDPVSLKIIGIYTQNAASAYAASNPTAAVSGFTLVVGGKVQMTPQFFAAVDYSYSFTPKTWNVVGDLGWNVANGFAVLGEVKYTSAKVTSGFLRFQRSF